MDPVGINDPGANFGMGYYNDHHFHFGYFVYAAAVLAKERPDFVQTYGSAIINLIRDYSNPALSVEQNMNCNFFFFMAQSVRPSRSAKSPPFNLLKTLSVGNPECMMVSHLPRNSSRPRDKKRTSLKTFLHPRHTHFTTYLY